MLLGNSFQIELKVISKLAHMKTRVGSTLKYRCERGYILKSESGQDLRVMTRRCTTTGDWTGDTPTCIYVDCGMPETQENTGYTLQTNNGTYYGSVVNYKCHDHFKLDGKRLFLFSNFVYHSCLG